MCLARYEIAMVECMHDIANHIDNILEELLNHLKGDKVKFTEMVETHKAEKKVQNIATIDSKSTLWNIECFFHNLALGFASCSIMKKHSITYMII